MINSQNLNLLSLLISRLNSVKNALFLSIYAKQYLLLYIVVVPNIFPHFRRL